MAEAQTPQVDDSPAGGQPEGNTFVGNFFTPEFIEDPYPSYRFLLEHQPVSGPGRAVAHSDTRYEDCQTLLRDRRLGHAFKEGMIEQWGARVFENNPVYRSLGNSILLMDPPDHRRAFAVSSPRPSTPGARKR